MPISIRRHLHIPLALLTALTLTACSSTPAPPNDATTPALASDHALAPILFMQGTWRATESGSYTEEHWSAPAADSMIGYSRTIATTGAAPGRTKAFEFLRLVARRPDAASPLTIDYLASPGGRGTPTPFRLTDSAPHRAVFTNPEHDFPKRLTYWLDDANRLHARIDAMNDNPAQTQEWIYERLN